MDIKEIRTLIDLMKKNGVAVFKMEREGFKITLKTSEAGGPVHFVTSGVAPAAAPTPTTAAAPATPPPAAVEAGIETHIANGRHPERLADIVACKGISTKFTSNL